MSTCTTCNTPQVQTTGSCNSCFAIDRAMTLNETIFFSDIQLMIGDCDITSRCQFAWSIDKVNWSCWNTYEGYKMIAPTLNSDFYLRILFREPQVPQLYINNILTNCYSVVIFFTNPFLNDPCSIISASGFDLYSGWDCALMMQQQLSDNVICMIGVPIVYFRVSPQEETKSYTFKEYVLHNVESIKQLKMMFPDGQMPSSRPTISEWDMEFDVDWDVELSKTQFATAFGPDEFPKQRDFIWVPMQKRMYMVNTAYEEKNENLLWRAVTWKLSLVKWQEQSNIDQGEFEAVIDSLIAHPYSEALEPGEIREGEMTGVLQVSTPAVTATNLYSIEDSDYIRKQISIDTMKIVDRQVNHGNLIVAKNKYIFYKESAITYQKDWCGENGTLSLIFDYTDATIKEEKTIISIGGFDLKMKDNSILLGSKKVPIEAGNTYLMVLRWGRSVGETSINLYKLNRPDVPSYRLRPTMYTFDFKSPVVVSERLDERLVSGSPVPVVLRGYPLHVCNLKLYNRYINDENLDEVLKYVTKDKYCLINDQARSINGDHGYNIS